MDRIQDKKQLQHQLKRSISLFQAIMYGIGLILGAGIYVIVGDVAGIAGNAMWISFIVAAFIALLTGFSYAELLSLIALFATANTALMMLISASRIIYGMARNAQDGNGNVEASINCHQNSRFSKPSGIGSSGITNNIINCVLIILLLLVLETDFIRLMV
jgi:amino acid transporter